MSIYEKIIASAEAQTEELTALRRDLHKHPETGWFEMRTTSIIARKLTEMGYEVLLGEDVCLKESRMGVPSDEALEKHYQQALEQGADPEFLPYTKGGMTGAIAILRCGEGPTVALRFDIDALGVIESDEADHIPVKEGFVSINHGAMHACGHDGHTCVGLGVAKTLMEIKDQLHGTVKLIFQPAEEGVRGAKSIVDKGHLDDVDYCIGAHITPNDPELSDVTPGAYGSLATCKYDVTYRGLSAHASGSPQLGKNAMLAAATAVMNLNAIPRHSDGGTRINVGRLIAGTGRNVIPDEAFMEIEVRGDTTELNDYMCQKAMAIIKHSAEMYDCTYDVKLMGAASSVMSDEDFARSMGEIAGKVGLKSSSRIMGKSTGSEDFAYMMNKVQENGGKAVFMRVRTTTFAPGHNRRYDFVESDYLPKSIKLFCAGVYDLMK